MNKWRALYLSARPLNLLIMAATMYAVRYAIFYPNTDRAMKSLSYPELNFFFLVLSIILLGAAGNIINDVLDVRVDKENKEGKNLVGISLSETFAMNLYKAITLSGLLIGLILSWSVGKPMLFVIHLFIAASLWYYSYSMQKQVLIGNVVISVLVALLPIIVAAFEFTAFGNRLIGEDHFSSAAFISTIQFAYPATYIFAVFAFLITMAREIIKDIMDSRGDRQGGYRTFPIAYGNTYARQLAMLILILTLGVLIWTMTLMVKYLPVGIEVLISFGLLCSTPIVLALIELISERKDNKRISTYLKVAMVCGIVSSSVFYFI